MFSNLLVISYKWRFYAGIVRMWSYVESRCYNGVCGTSAPPAWVKGPKYVAGINGTVDGTRFTRLLAFDTHGTAVCGYDRTVTNSSSATGQCPSNAARYNGLACTNSFESNCPGRDRARVQYDYATPTGDDNPTSNPPGCSTTNRCFEAGFRAFNAYPYGPWPSYFIGDGGLTVDTYGWDPFGPTSSTSGLSAGWAENATFRAPEDPNDPCPVNGSSMSDPAYPAAVRWELIGFKPSGTYAGSYASANTYAFGWLDCKNVGATVYPIPAGTSRSAYNYGGAFYRAYPPKPDGYGANAYGTFASFSFKDDRAFDNVEGLR